MLPVQDVIPSTRTPLVTLTLVAASGALAVYLAGVTPPSRLTFLLRYGLVPAWATPWSFVTSQVVQPDLVSGFLNLLALWIFGDNVEARLGRVGFVATYVGGGVLAAVASVAIDPAARLVLPAAAGAAASVMGAYLVLLPRSRVMVLVPVWKALDLVDVPAVVVILCWLALHVMRHAGTIAAPAPLTGAVIVPLAGLAAGSIAGRLLGRGTVSRNW